MEFELAPELQPNSTIKRVRINSSALTLPAPNRRRFAPVVGQRRCIFPVRENLSSWCRPVSLPLEYPGTQSMAAGSIYKKGSSKKISSARVAPFSFSGMKKAGGSVIYPGWCPSRPVSLPVCRLRRWTITKNQQIFPAQSLNNLQPNSNPEISVSRRRHASVESGTR
ncbi:MAG: hypothetical protein QOJ99_3729 [Bryobacterales bacterium]|nr:hypothetical protein [Bryobacterales bacterium]